MATLRPIVDLPQALVDVLEESLLSWAPFSGLCESDR